MWARGGRGMVGARIDFLDAEASLEWPLLKRVFGYFSAYWSHALLALVTIVLGAALGLVPALVTKTLIDRVLRPGVSFQMVALVVLAGVLAGLGEGILGVLRSYIQNAIAQGIMFDLRNELFSRLLDQSIAFFTRIKTGDIMSRLSSDVSGIQSVVSDTLFSLVANAFLIGSTTVLMLYLDWRLAIVSLVVLPLFVLPTRQVGRATFTNRRQGQEKLGELNSYIAETLGISGILLVKAFVRGAAERARFGALTDELRRINIHTMLIGRWFFAMMGFLTTGGPAVLWLIGGYLVVTRQASLGTVVTFATVLLARLYGPVSQVASLHVNVIGSLALFQRIFEYLDLEVRVASRPDAPPLREVRGEIRFEGVTFAYSSRSRPALSDVSFTVDPGQLVALVGPSGAGKTTITSLIPRFYDPLSGSVRIDGQDVRDVTLESVGHQVGIVFQDTFLFHTTVRENLLYARPDATDDELRAACRSAYMDHVIEALPDGYETVVGERGHRLSGGEKQRLAIARVILKDPRILVLDEATSNLDTESERLIQAALQPLFRGRTSVVIAHRLSTVLAADQILVMERGRLVEQGTHRELLASSGLYARLYRLQFEPEVRAG
ncbi:MAG TPA: ABC transporter ATP-binding protein [Candidatus Dormibacteraeota bacterium]|jgi:ATP-binding cassette subfamily B protein